MTWAAFFAAWAVHFVAAASPGPAVFVTARTGVTRGFRTACWLGVGVAFGACFWAMAAYLGLSVLFKALPSVFLAFKIACAGSPFRCGGMPISRLTAPPKVRAATGPWPPSGWG